MEDSSPFFPNDSIDLFFLADSSVTWKKHQMMDFGIGNFFCSNSV